MAARGLALASPERRREIASAGGRAAQQGGNGRRWTDEQARAAGKLGGEKVSADREHMARIGRMGAAAKMAAAAASEKEGDEAGPAVLVSGEALQDVAARPGYAPPQLPRPSCAREHREQRTTPAPAAPPHTAAERIEEAARARAEQRLLIVDRGLRWHVQAAAHVRQQNQLSKETP